jgi:hypothetical protein
VSIARVGKRSSVNETLDTINFLRARNFYPKFIIDVVITKIWNGIRLKGLF